MSRRVAVVVNTSRLRRPAALRSLIERELFHRGWEPPLWLPTTATDPGTGQARAARDAGADLVLAVGGDGTVRAVLQALAGSDTPVGLIPSGTGNLLARNLRIPLTARRSLRLALDGTPTPIDLLRWEGTEADGRRRSGTAAVMVGMGADAAVLHDTDEALKRRVGQGAYIVAGLGHVKAIPVPTSITIDGGAPLVRDASLVEIGNVGDLMVGVSLLPGASVNDGLLDVLVASPRGALDVAKMIGGVLLQQSHDQLLDRRSGRRVVVEMEWPVLCQVDGDLVGEVQRLEVGVLPGAVSVVLPSRSVALPSPPPGR